MVEFAHETDILGFEEYPEEVDLMLQQAEWSDRLNKQRVGTVLTFSLNEKRNEQYIRYNVDELSDGTSVFLIRPAWLNQGYDYKVCVEGWDDSSNPAPSHTEIYSDLYWKREYDDAESFKSICEAVIEIHKGESPDSVIEQYSDNWSFSVGRVPDALIRSLPWLFIEQDIRYWNYTGRNMTIEIVQKLYDGTPISELDIDLQELESIHKSELSITQN